MKKKFFKTTILIALVLIVPNQLYAEDTIIVNSDKLALLSFFQSPDYSITIKHVKSYLESYDNDNYYVQKGKGQFAFQRYLEDSLALYKTQINDYNKDKFYVMFFHAFVGDYDFENEQFQINYSRPHNFGEMSLKKSYTTFYFKIENMGNYSFAKIPRSKAEKIVDLLENNRGIYYCLTFRTKEQYFEDSSGLHAGVYEGSTLVESPYFEFYVFDENDNALPLFDISSSGTTVKID